MKVLITQLRDSGFRVNYLSETNFLLDVEYKRDSISKEQIQTLNKISDNITFLKLSNCNLSNDLLNDITNIKNLTRIDLSKNKLSNNAVPFLVKLEHLESANLNETDIDNESLRNLLAKSSILRIYVSDTKVTPEEISNLIKVYPQVEIISQFKFEKVIEAKSDFQTGRIPIKFSKFILLANMFYFLQVYCTNFNFIKIKGV